MKKFKNHLRNLDIKKASQDADITEKIIKENSYLFAHFR